MGLTSAESVETKMQKKANERNIEPSRTTKAGSFLSIFTQGNKLRIYDQQANDNWAEFKNSHAEAAEERSVWEKGIARLVLCGQCSVSVSGNSQGTPTSEVQVSIHR